MSKVTVRNLVKRFGNLEAVKGINFDIEDKQFAVILGPSGCGKTTTLRCIAGLEKPDEGAIFFDRDKVNNLTPSERNIAFVFQFYALYPHLNVWDNIAFPLRAAKISPHQVRKRVNRTLKILELEDLDRKRPSSLTPGQRQRVALGRAIVRQPRVFLLDEPLSNLDAKIRERMRAELKRLFNDIGATTICVTHDQLEAMSMADKIILMRSGEIQQMGSPLEIYNNPANLFVANFIGSPGMNFLPCEYRTDGKPKFVGEKDTFTILLNSRAHNNLQELTDNKVVLGVRPEDIEFCSHRFASAIKAEVYLIEPLGSQKIVNLKIGEDNILKATVENTFDVAEGEISHIIFKKVCIFDGTSENNLISIDGEELWQKSV